MRPSFEPGPVRERAGKLRDLVRAIAQERRVLREARKKWEEEKKALESRMRGLSIRAAVLKDRSGKARRSAEELEKERAELLGKKAGVESVLQNVRRILERGAGKLRESAAASLPWRRRERGAASGKLARQSRDPDKSIPDLFRLLWERLTEESALLRTFETSALPANIEGVRKVLPSLRVGRVFVLQYDPENGEARALWVGKGGEDKALKITGGSAENVLSAMKIARRKKAPAIVPLPMPKELVAKRVESPNQAPVSRK